MINKNELEALTPNMKLVELRKAYNNKKESPNKYQQMINLIAGEMKQNPELKSEILSSPGLYAKVAGDLHEQLKTNPLEIAAYKSKRMARAMGRAATTASDATKKAARGLSNVGRLISATATAAKRTAFGKGKRNSGRI